MKMHREGYEYQRIFAPTDKKTDFEATKFIVWLGSGAFWHLVYRCKLDNRLYVHLASHAPYELLDTFNIRKTDILV